MSENLFYTLCHAVKDLSFEVCKDKTVAINIFSGFSLWPQAVYYIIPQSSGLTDDEFISRNDFEHSEFWNDSLFIPLQCNNQSLREAATKREEERQSKDGRDKGNPGITTDDVQKKITPWSSSSDTIMNELFPDQSDYPVTSNRKPPGGELILVASLLHKPPNLGGKICIHLCSYEFHFLSDLITNSTVYMHVTK